MNVIQTQCDQGIILIDIETGIRYLVQKIIASGQSLSDALSTSQTNRVTPKLVKRRPSNVGVNLPIIATEHRLTKPQALKLGCVSVTELATELGSTRNKFFEILREAGWINNDNAMPTPAKIQAGLMVIVGNKDFPSANFTPEGVRLCKAYLKKHRYLG